MVYWDKHRVRRTSSQTNIELISKNKCLLRQISSQTNTEYLIEIYKIWSTGTNIESDKHQVRQTSSQTNIELISKNKCLLRQTSSQTNTEYLIEIYKIWSTGTNIESDKHQVRQTSS